MVAIGGGVGCGDSFSRCGSHRRDPERPTAIVDSRGTWQWARSADSWFAAFHSMLSTWAVAKRHVVRSPRAAPKRSWPTTRDDRSPADVEDESPIVRSSFRSQARHAATSIRSGGRRVNRSRGGRERRGRCESKRGRSGAGTQATRQHRSSTRGSSLSTCVGLRAYLFRLVSFPGSSN